MMFIDFTPELAPIGLALGVLLTVCAIGILFCADERELPTLRRWVQSVHEVVVVSTRRVLHAGRLASTHRG